jgi:hypothetical protein
MFGRTQVSGTRISANVEPGIFRNVIAIELVRAIVPTVAFVYNDGAVPYLILDVEELRNDCGTHGTMEPIQRAFAILTPDLVQTTFTFCTPPKHKIIWKDPRSITSMTFRLYKSFVSQTSLDADAALSAAAFTTALNAGTTSLAHTNGNYVSGEYTSTDAATRVTAMSKTVLFHMKFYTVDYQMGDLDKPEALLHTQLLSKPQ